MCYGRDRGDRGHSSIALYYISLLSGLGNIDDQNRNPNINNRDHLFGQLRATAICFALFSKNVDQCVSVPEVCLLIVIKYTAVLMIKVWC